MYTPVAKDENIPKIVEIPRNQGMYCNFETDFTT